MTSISSKTKTLLRFLKLFGVLWYKYVCKIRETKKGGSSMREPETSFNYKYEAIKYIEILVSSVSSNAVRAKLANDSIAKTVNIYSISNIKPQFNKGLITSVTVTVKMAHTHLSRVFIFQFIDEDVDLTSKEVPNDT